MQYNKLITDVRQWFKINKIDNAVVGYSGGIDSTTTIALLLHAGITVHAVLAEIDGQKRESDYSLDQLVNHYYQRYDLPPLSLNYINLPLPKKVLSPFLTMSDDVFNEAALPIMRNAAFYGIAADIRSVGGSVIVVGTANFDEASFLGFWGKASDASQDFYPISHLHKSEVYDLAKELHVPYEIINATPSGDLQWSGDLNDLKMIGCDYGTVEKIAKLAMDDKYMDIVTKISEMPSPDKFVSNVLKNEFKYRIPFGQQHLYTKLEDFRTNYYNVVYQACKSFRDLDKSW